MSAPTPEFAADCEAHRPWLWKDPRLAMTMRFWARIIDVSRVRFIVVHRRLDQLWTSMLLERQIVTPRYVERYESGILASVRQWLTAAGLTWHELVYEDLLIEPAARLSELNAFLGTDIDESDLRAVYRHPLGRPARGLLDRIRARATYVKNYRQRLR